jgi:hypothetical protein
MGYGAYTHEAHEAITRSREKLPQQEVFKQRTCHPLMNPLGVGLRECRDSPTHPDSLGIVFALDVTGSMGKVPDLLARTELPKFMKSLLEVSVADPQVLFLAAGDAVSDRAPLQVGQFESAEREMDQWLTWTFLEAGGGPVGSESYELALYFCARHTALDCWEKRQRRGYLFLTGDEKPYPRVSKQQVKTLIGDDLADDLPLARVVADVSQSYRPFFLIPDAQRRARCERAWRDVLGDHVICMEDPADTCAVASSIVALGEGALADLDAVASRLRASGTDPARIGAVVRALTPWCASLARDAAPGPTLDPASLGAEGTSRQRRP